MTTQIEAWAWELPYPNGTYLTDIRIGSEKPPFDPRKLNLRPLYSIRAALAQPEPPQRKPLHASEIVTMYAECPTSDKDMVDFARAVEAAHGIKGDV